MALQVKTTEANPNLQSWNVFINLLMQYTTRAQLGPIHFTKQGLGYFAGDLSDFKSGHDVVYVNHVIVSLFSFSKLTYQISQGNKSLAFSGNHYSISHSNRA